MELCGYDINGEGYLEIKVETNKSNSLLIVMDAEA